MRGGESVCSRHGILRSARAMPTFVALDDVFIGKAVEEKQSSESFNRENPDSDFFRRTSLATGA